MRRRWLVIAATATVLVGIAVVGARLLDPGEVDTPAATGRDRAVSAPDFTVLTGVTLRPRRADDSKHAGCRPAARHAFVPVRASATDATAGTDVLALARDGNGVPGVPPLTSTGKNEFAWDAPGIRPGSPEGHVLLNAHTWPDGSALGNRLLAGLDRGEQVALHGAAGEVLCYRVTDRVEVPADQPFDRYYAATGKPQVAIVVCSGTRLGPGRWTTRTVWFADPVG